MLFVPLTAGVVDELLASTVKTSVGCCVVVVVLVVVVVVVVVVVGGARDVSGINI